MFDIDNDNEPASVMVGTSVGNKYDINNLSGKKKKQLIAEGDMSEDAFTAPPNMPGKKLAELRKEKRSNKVESNPNIENTYSVGDIIKFRDLVAEVLKVHAKKGVLITKRDGSKTWVHHSKIELASEPNEE